MVGRTRAYHTHASKRVDSRTAMCVPRDGSPGVTVDERDTSVASSGGKRDREDSAEKLCAQVLQLKVDVTGDAAAR